MPARKMRVEIVDSDGNRYTVAFEGHLTRATALHLLELVELLGGMPTVDPQLSAAHNSRLTKFDRLRALVQEQFPLVWFSSKDVQTAYEGELKEPIGLSTVSTYLSRMVDRRILVQDSTAVRRRLYRITPKSSQVLSFTREDRWQSL